MNGERGGDDVPVGKPELSPKPVGATVLEPGVEAHLGSEGAAWGRERRTAARVGSFGVRVGEPGAIAAQDHDVPGGTEVWLETRDWTTGGGVGEPESEVAGLADGLADDGVAGQLHQHPVDGGGAHVTR